jgi:hypothetical protein
VSEINKHQFFYLFVLNKTYRIEIREQNGGIGLCVCIGVCVDAPFPSCVATRCLLLAMLLVIIT